MSELRTIPRQRRAHVRLSDLINATKEAVALHGIRDLTTGHLAELSGSSIGVVYRYFPDKWAALDAAYPPFVTTAEEVAALDPGTVLLCRVGEVFWLAPGQTERWWFAAGYPEGTAWTDEQVTEWGPLKVLHRPGVHDVVLQPAVYEKLRRA